jgi:hypothetical protein
MLSDVLCQFGWDVKDEGKPILPAAKQLLVDVNFWYDFWGYPLEHINPLRNAIRAVLDNPYDERLANHLLTVTDAIRAFYDYLGDDDAYHTELNKRIADCFAEQKHLLSV